MPSHVYVYLNQRQNIKHGERANVRSTQNPYIESKQNSIVKCHHILVRELIQIYICETHKNLYLSFKI